MYAIINNTYTSGNFTITTAFPNTWSTFLDTGLSELHGFSMWVQDMPYYVSGQGNGAYYIFTVNEDSTLAWLGINIPTSTTQLAGKLAYNLAQETFVEGAGLQGYIRLNGGIIEYKARYNRNANYQIAPNNRIIEWIAW